MESIVKNIILKVLERIINLPEGPEMVYATTSNVSGIFKVELIVSHYFHIYF